MKAVAAFLVIAAGVTAAPTKFTWKHEGYPRILKAAAEAKQGGQRLLLGLSGAPS